MIKSRIGRRGHPVFVSGLVESGQRDSMRRMLRSAIRVCVSTFGVLLTQACGDVAATNPVIADDALWSVQCNVSSVVMSTQSPYDTLTLIPTVRNASGAVVPTPKEVRFFPSDSTLQVSSSGIVTALETTTTSFVVVSVYDSVRLRTIIDTVFIRVTDNPSPSRLKSFTLGLPPGDSAKLAVVTGTLNQRMDALVVSVATDEENTDVTSQLFVEYISRNPLALKVGRRDGVVTSVLPNRKVTIVAVTTFYGVTKSDSIEFVTGYPLVENATMVKAHTENGGTTLVFYPKEITIGRGGTVVFNSTIAEFDVMFENPAAAKPSPYVVEPGYITTGAGNVATLPKSETIEQLIECIQGLRQCAVARSFADTGTYQFRDSRSGAVGKIVVLSP